MAKCEMHTEEPYPFAWCETHDETFALGKVCPFYVAESGGIGEGSDA